MFARATSGDKPNNRKFSSCSTKTMGGVLSVKGICTDARCCFTGKESCNEGSFGLTRCVLLSRFFMQNTSVHLYTCTYTRTHSRTHTPTRTFTCTHISK